MVEKYRRLLQISEQLLNFVGINFVKIKYLVTWSQIGCVFVHWYLALYGFLFDQLNFDQTMSMILSATVLSHASVKMLALIVRRHDIEAFIEQVDYFWDIESKLYDAKFKTECLQILNFWRKILNAYKYYVTIIILFASVGPFIYGDLAIVCHEPPIKPRWIFITFNSFTLASCGFFVLGFDFLFCSMLVLLRLQLKILNYNVSLINYEIREWEYFQKQIKKVVEYHNFLLESFNRVNRAFGPMLLMYLGICMFGMCSMVYAVSQSNERLSAAFKYGSFYVALAVQLFWFYCFPSKLLNDQVSDLATTVYNSNWCLCPHLSVKKYLVLIMARAQQETTISAGKMIPLDMTTFTRVFKATLTFYTFIQNMKKLNS